jgi:serine/threonine-protein kinase HipA
VDIKPRILSTNITWDEGTAWLDLAFEVAEYFKLSKGRALSIVKQVGKAVASWKKEATNIAIGKSEQEQMACAFEHDDLRKARK